MDDIEKIADKVKKLLALAGNNSSQAEAEQAMLAAQKLLAAHGMEMADVERAQPKSDIISDVSKLHVRMPWWHRALARVICDNFKCAFLHNFDRDRDGKLIGTNIKFFGHPQDVQICKTVYQYAIIQTEYLVRLFVKRYRKLYPHYSGAEVKNTWLQGFISGLKDKFREQVEANGWGLVVLADALTVKAKDAEVTGKTRRSTIRVSNVQEVHAAGYREGRRFEPTMGKLE